MGLDLVEVAPAAETDAEAEDDVALGSPAKHHETVEDIAAALGVVSLDAPTEDADVETRAAAEPPLARFLAECGQSARFPNLSPCGRR